MKNDFQMDGELAGQALAVLWITAQIKLHMINPPINT